MAVRGLADAGVPVVRTLFDFVLRWSIGHARQQADLIGFALLVNSLTLTVTASDNGSDR